MKWLRRIFGCKHEWQFEHGHITNDQLRDYERLVGACWSLSTYYERSKRGIEVYGWVCSKCGKSKPATESDVQAESREVSE